MDKLKISTQNLAPFARDDAHQRCVSLTKLFSKDILEAYGLPRTARVFDDIMRGGKECEKIIREAYEKELPVNSKLHAIAASARNQINDAINDFRVYVAGFKKASSTTQTGKFCIIPDYVKFDGEKVVLSDEGAEVLDNMENIYLTNEEQIKAHRLAEEIKRLFDELMKICKPYRVPPIETDFHGGILDFRPDGTRINGQFLVQIGKNPVL